MEEMSTVIEMFKGAWPAIQPGISTVFGALVANLFLKSNTSKTEIEKIKQAKFSEIADKLLEGGHITHLEYYKCRNFNRIAKKADEVFQHSGSIAQCEEGEKNLTIDWFVRFFEDAGNISDEQMQELWAKVLAGEIKQPGSFSLRTLEVLRNLSKEEAEILQEIASYAIPFGDEYYICIDDELKKTYQYQRKLRVMYDCGIIENNLASHYDLTATPESALMRVGSLLCISHNQSPERYALDLQRFTKTGNEFIRFVSSNEKYVIDFFQRIKKQYPNLHLTVHHIIEENNGNFSYMKDSLI